MPDEAPVVLVVEDESIRTFICDFLSWHGLRSLAASGGTQAIELARRHLPDLVLLDLRLERGPDGEDVLKTLKAEPRTREIPVIAMSGFEKTTADEVRLMRAGAHSLMSKEEAFEVSKEHPQLIRRIKALVSLRRENAAARASSVESPPPPKDGARERASRVRTVLVIDGQRGAAQRIQNLLWDEPCRVLAAETGSKGLSLAGVELPDLVIVELSLPDMEGRHVCGKLLADAAKSPHDLPVMILTTDERPAREAECLRLGAADYVPKSAPAEVLKAKIISLLRRRLGENSEGMILAGVFSLDTIRHQLRIGAENAIALRPVETAILADLLAAKGKVVERGRLSKKALRRWPSGDSDPLCAHVSRIRSKLGAYSEALSTLRDSGYLFDANFRPKAGATKSGP